MRAAIYTRVSTDEQGDSGLSLDSQAQWCTDEAARRGWTVQGVHAEVVSTGKPLEKRPELAGLLERLDARELDALLVRRLDRLCRSITEFQQFLERSQRHGWELLMLEPQVDTTTPFGRAMASMAAVFAQLERELNSQRTREAMQALRDRGESCGGAPAFSDPQVIAQIKSWSSVGLSQHQIAERLTVAGVPTQRGGAWRQSTVRSILSRA